MIKNKKITVILFALIVFVALNQISAVRANTQLFILNIASYLEKYLASPMLYFKSKKQLEEENKNLKQKLSHLRFTQINNLALKQELKEVQALLSIQDDNKKDTDKVLLKLEPSVAPRINFLWLKGVEHLPDGKYFVLAPQGFVLADFKARQAANKEARLLSAIGRNISARMISKNEDGREEKIKVVLQGKGSGKFETKINKEFNISVGDVIFYQDFPVAQIVDISDEEQSPYKIVHATTPFNLDTLDRILLVPYE